MTKHQVYIPISKISEFCGLNRYVPKQESFFNTFKKNNVLLYNNILKKINREDKNEQNKDLIEKLDINSLIEESINSEDKINKKLKEIEKIVQTDLTNLSIPEGKLKIIVQNVKEQSRKKINTERGIRKEETSLDNVEKLKDMNITDRNSELYTDYIETDNINCKICGRIDGIEEETKTIIEHKQRMNKLFVTIPPYEVIQIYFYMYITNNTKAKLVQTYKNEINILYLEWCDEKWGKIIDKFHKSLEEYYNIVKDKNKIEKLVKKYTVEKINSQKKNCINKYFNISN